MVSNGFWHFLILFNSFIKVKNKKLEFWDSNNSTDFKNRELENHRCKVYRLALDSWSNTFVEAFLKTTCTLSVLKILLYEYRLILRTTQWIRRSEIMKLSLENQNKYFSFVGITCRVFSLQAYKTFWLCQIYSVP